MSAVAARIDLNENEADLDTPRAREDSQVCLKAPSVPPEPADADFDAPLDFVAFLGAERGLDEQESFELLCRLLSEFRTPVRYEIDVLQRSA
ncbi:MAG: hypothetical protein QM756_07370 [Polyangiaceae bacterium]